MQLAIGKTTISFISFVLRSAGAYFWRGVDRQLSPAMDPWTFYRYPNAILRNTKYVCAQVDEYWKVSETSFEECTGKSCRHTIESVKVQAIKDEVVKENLAQDGCTRRKNANDVPIQNERAEEKRRGPTRLKFTVEYITTKSCEVDVKLSGGRPYLTFEQIRDRSSDLKPKSFSSTRIVICDSTGHASSTDSPPLIQIFGHGVHKDVVLEITRMGSYSGQRTGASEPAGIGHHFLQRLDSACFQAGGFINEVGARRRRAFIDNCASESYWYSGFNHPSTSPRPLRKTRLSICSLDSRVPDLRVGNGRRPPCDQGRVPSEIYFLQILDQRAATDPGLMELLRKVKVREASEDELMKYKHHISQERIRFNTARRAAADEKMNIQKERKVEQILKPRPSNPYKGHQSMDSYPSVSSGPSIPHHTFSPYTNIFHPVLQLSRFQPSVPIDPSMPGQPPTHGQRLMCGRPSMRGQPRMRVYPRMRGQSSMRRQPSMRGQPPMRGYPPMHGRLPIAYEISIPVQPSMSAEPPMPPLPPPSIPAQPAMAPEPAMPRPPTGPSPTGPSPRRTDSIIRFVRAADNHLHSYFAQNGSAPLAKEKDTLGKLFEKYRGMSMHGRPMKVVS
jgi:hypothetical protein